MMTYLEVLKKVQKVYRSCITFEQIEIAKKYVILMVNKWSRDTIRNGGGGLGHTVITNHKRSGLVRHCKFLRLQQINKVSHRKDMDYFESMVIDRMNNQNSVMHIPV